jgi:hypothetical protein
MEMGNEIMINLPKVEPQAGHLTQAPSPTIKKNQAGEER